MQEEFLMLGLRMNKGISISEFNIRFNCNFYNKFKNVISKLQKLQLIDIVSDNLFLTEKGLDLCDSVVLEFIEEL